MRDFFDKVFMWMDAFDTCCMGNLEDKGDGWEFPGNDDEPGFRAFLCRNCGRLWFKDKPTDRFYAYRTSWLRNKASI